MAAVNVGEWLGPAKNVYLFINTLANTYSDVLNIVIAANGYMMVMYNAGNQPSGFNGNAYSQ